MEPTNTRPSQTPGAQVRKTAQVEARNWQRWERHCAELAELRREVIDPLDAPFWVFQSLFTPHTKNGEPLSADAIRKIVWAVTRRSQHVVPAHKRPEHAAEWRQLLRVKERREGRSRRTALHRLSLAEIQRSTAPAAVQALLQYMPSSEARTLTAAQVHQPLGDQTAADPNSADDSTGGNR